MASGLRQQVGARPVLNASLPLVHSPSSSLSASASTSVRRQMLVPDTVFFISEESSALGEAVQKEEEPTPPSRQRCNSDSFLRADDIRRGHEQFCIRRAEAVKRRGISLLNEVDAQYSALQVRWRTRGIFTRTLLAPSLD